MDVTNDGQSISDNSGRALDVLGGRLRGKIEINPKNPSILKTERGIGYVFATEVRKNNALFLKFKKPLYNMGDGFDVPRNNFCLIMVVF